MNSDEVHDLLVQVRKLSGSNAKKLALARNTDSVLSLVLHWTYNPYLRYYMKDPVTRGEGKEHLSEQTWRLLGSLADRTLTGYAAVGALSVHLRMLTPKSAALLRRVVNKDLKIGVGAKTINAVFPGLVPEHPIMLAKLFEERRFRGPMFTSPKIDGVRAVFKDGKFRSRRGHEYLGLEELADVLPNAVILDGELTVPGKTFQEGSGLIRSDNPVPDAVFHLLDVQGYPVPFYERYMMLEDIVGYEQPGIDIVPHHKVHTLQGLYEYYKAHRSLGYEGSVVKPLDYQDYLYV